MKVKEDIFYWKSERKKTFDFKTVSMMDKLIDHMSNEVFI